MPKFKDVYPSQATRKGPKMEDADQQSRRDGAISMQRCKHCYWPNPVDYSTCSFCGSLNWK